LAPLIIAKVLARLAVAREVKTQSFVQRRTTAYHKLETSAGARPFVQRAWSHANQWKILIPILASSSVGLIQREMRSASRLMQNAAAEMEPGSAAMENAHPTFSLAQ
jgi:hypothetical protein